MNFTHFSFQNLLLSVALVLKSMRFICWRVDSISLFQISQHMCFSFFFVDLIAIFALFYHNNIICSESHLCLVLRFVFLYSMNSSYHIYIYFDFWIENNQIINSITTFDWDLFVNVFNFGAIFYILYSALASLACFIFVNVFPFIFFTHSHSLERICFLNDNFAWFSFFAVMEKFACGNFHRDCDAKWCYKPDDNIAKKLE